MCFVNEYLKLNVSSQQNKIKTQRRLTAVKDIKLLICLEVNGALKYYEYFRMVEKILNSR